MTPPSAAAESGECCSPAAVCCVVPMSSGAKYHAWGSRKHLGFLNSHPSEYPRPSRGIYSLSTGCILPQFPIPVHDLVSSDGRILSVLSVMSAFPRTSAARRQQRGGGAHQDLPRRAVRPSPCLVSDGKHKIRFLVISAFFGEPAAIVSSQRD